MSAPISIKLRSLTNRAGSFTNVVGREDTLRRLVRILLKPVHHHAAIIGDPGIGKSSLVELLALGISQGALPQLPQKIYLLDCAPIVSLFVSGDSPRTLFDSFRANIAKMERAVIVIEDIQLLAVDDPSRLELTMELLHTVTSNPNIRLIVTTTNTAYQRTFHADYIFNRLLVALELDELQVDVVNSILHSAASRSAFSADQQVLSLTTHLASQYNHGRALPDSALRLLEEVIAKISFDGGKNITADSVHETVSERERTPISSLDNQNKTQLSTLEERLNQAVIGQASAIKTITRTIINAELGLRDESRPRGSFLLLGPSGVGKTETAKTLAAHVYDSQKAMVRLDMSEYSEAHSAVRLTGSPPGYVGYEEGGQLTGAIAKQPNSLILLDEIEKAHPKLFDVFLQLLDDGRLTDSSGKTVDFTHSMVLATSNIGSREIASAAEQGEDVCSHAFLRKTLMPLLLCDFKPEFINRFDAILVYQPLQIPQLVTLAKRELAKLEARLATREIKFNISDQLLTMLLSAHYEPLFGARPVKRLVSNYFEMPIAERIVNGQLAASTTITGQEEWLGLLT